MDIKDLIERADNVASYLEKYYPEYFKDEEIEELSAQFFNEDDKRKDVLFYKGDITIIKKPDYFWFFNNIQYKVGRYLLLNLHYFTFF